MMKGNPNALSFEELVSIFLQEDQSMQNRSIMHVAYQVLLLVKRARVKEALLLVRKNLEMLRIQRMTIKMRRRQKNRKYFASIVRQLTI